MKKLISIFLFFIASTVFSGEPMESEGPILIDNDYTLNPPEVSGPVTMPSVNNDAATNSDKDWGLVQGSFGVTSQLILGGKPEEARKAAEMGVEAMERIEADAKSNPDVISERDLKEARETAASLKDFVSNGKTLKDPGQDKEYYFDTELKKMKFKDDKGHQLTISQEDLDNAKRARHPSGQ